MSDDQWLVFDIRSSGASSIGEIIEHVSIHTGEVEVIHHASQDAYVGVATVHPKPEKYVLIHGPEDPDEIWHYSFHHRHGVTVEGSKTNSLDAMDIIALYMSGVLRGGSHVRVFSPSDERMSFTYNDHVVHEPDPALGLRNVDIAAPFDPVNVQKQYPREYNGSHWYVLVSKTTPTPQPGSGEINRTYEEGWVGNHALVFIGDTLSPKGGKVSELFIVELPQGEADWKAVDDASLSGTEATLPASPRSVVWRRLTFTHHRAYPGLANVSRHRVRCSSRGIQIAFLIRDDNGTVQLQLISPQGGESHQLTHNRTGIQSASNWHPSGEWLDFALDNRIAYAHAQSGEAEYLTERHANSPSTDAVVFLPDGQWLAWMEGGQLWITETDRQINYQAFWLVE